MGNFYNPPPPSQGPSNSTLPLPHDPIPAQGDQPPRRQVAAVLAMCAVLASWPADLEPRLQAPNNQQTKIAPLTLTYGSQPIPIAALSPAKLGQAISAWAITWDAQAAPKSASWNVPPLAIVPYTPRPALIWTSWEPPSVKPPQPVSIAPLTLVYGAQPTPQPPLNRVAQTTIVASWPLDVGPLVAWPNATPTRIVPLTLPRGDQPRPHGPLALSTLTQTATSWVQTWNAQRGPSWQVQPGTAVASRPQVFQLLAGISNIFGVSAGTSNTESLPAGESHTQPVNAGTSNTVSLSAARSDTWDIKAGE